MLNQRTILKNSIRATGVSASIPVKKVLNDFAPRRWLIPGSCFVRTDLPSCSSDIPSRRRVNVGDTMLGTIAR